MHKCLNMELGMYKKYFKIAFRDVLKNKLYWAINSLGLAIGAAVSLLVFQYATYEFSYDTFYQHTDQIFRVQIDQESANGDQRQTLQTPGNLSKLIKANIPQIELAGATQPFMADITLGERKTTANQLHFAERDLLEILEVKFIEGSLRNQFQNPDEIVLTESHAEKIFGPDVSPLGRLLKIETRYQGQLEVIITGVIEDLPDNSHFESTGFVSMLTLDRIFSPYVLPQSTYVRSKPGTDTELLNKSLTDMAKEKSLTPDQYSQQQITGISLFPVSEIHFSTDPVQQARGNKRVVTTFLVFGLLILVIASTNYMNLSTARFTQKSRQIGIRKVLGARKKHIIGLTLAESFIMSLSALLIGGLMAEFGSIMFNKITSANLQIGFARNLSLFLRFSFFTLLAGMISGCYPAIQASEIKAATALRGTLSSGKKGRNLRRILVMIQFVISGGLIVSTLVIYSQMRFISKKDLGFNPKNIAIVELPKNETEAEFFRYQLSLNPKVSAISTSTAPLGLWRNRRQMEIQNQEGEKVIERISYSQVEDNFLEIMDFEVLTGREFAQSSPGKNGVLVNEALVTKMGWESPLRESVTLYNYETRQYDQHMAVIGVVKDFHVLSLYNSIEPFVFFPNTAFQSGQRHLIIKANNEDGIGADMMDSIHDTFIKTRTRDNYSGFILESRIESLYAKEQVRAKIYLVLTSLSITVACLGLFGLAFFSVKVRTQEIAIRKVLGASLTGIVAVLSKEFILIVTIACVLAFPLATSLMRTWLDTFAYRISIGVEIFFFAILATVFIAFSSIFYQSVKTSLINPASTLRNE